jgi:hypothetical protein
MCVNCSDMKRTLTTLASLATALFGFALQAVPALAVTNATGAPPTAYVAAFAPIFGSYGVPRTGTMSLAVNDGTISGTYSGTSVSPDFLDNRIVPVTGTVSPNDGYIQLYIGGAITLRGSMAGNGTITGTAEENGRLYEFTAAPGTIRTKS